MQRIISKGLISASLVFQVLFLVAQDSPVKKSIDITSSYKPVIREASKILLHAQPLPMDSARKQLKYNIPVQPLSTSFQPVEISAANLAATTPSGWKHNNYLKLGFGNIYKPFIKAGLSFGNGKSTAANIFLDHSSSKGSLPFQQQNATSFSANGSYITPEHLEWTASVKVTDELYHRYGYSPSSLVYNKSMLEQGFNGVEGSLHLRNTVPTSYGLTFNPKLGIQVFGDKQSAKARESNVQLDLPLEKSLGRLMGVKLALQANLNSYEWQKNGGAINRTNKLLAFAPTFLLKTPNVYLHAGVRPSWDQSTFHLLPDLMIDFTTQDQRFTVQAGWIGNFQTNTYRSLSRTNPWLLQPDSIRNTVVREFYGGVKGSISTHFSYSTKLGLVEYDRMPLFVNDRQDGKSFELIYEKKLQALQVHSEVGYTVGEDLSFHTSFNFRKFTKVQQELKAWGLMPLELNSGVSWQVMKDLWLKSDLWVWDGAPYRTPNGSAIKGEGAFDLNAGAEFKVIPHLNIWVQLNNLFNSKYQRWHQYQNYGFSVMGGVVID